jgi:hypothetical protein
MVEHNTINIVEKMATLDKLDTVNTAAVVF